MWSVANVRLVVLAAALFLTSTPVLAQSPCLQAPPGVTSGSPPSSCIPTYNSGARVKYYFKITVGPRAFLASAATAGIQQARNAPSAWNQGIAGYERRYGSSFAKRGISNTVQLGVEAMLAEDSRYFYSERDDFWPRMKDAVIHSLVIRNRSGGREAPVGRLAGTLAGGLLSRTWQPEGHGGIGRGFRSGGISFGGYIASNIFREMTRGFSKHLPF